MEICAASSLLSGGYWRVQSSGGARSGQERRVHARALALRLLREASVSAGSSPFLSRFEVLRWGLSDSLLLTRELSGGGAWPMCGVVDVSCGNPMHSAWSECDPSS